MAALPHAAQPSGDDQPSGRIAGEMLPRDLRKRLVGSLHDALAADVDPRSRSPGDRLADRRGRPALWAGQAHQPAHRLDHQVEGRKVSQRTLLPETRDRGVDDGRVHRLDGLITEAQPVHHPGTEVLQQHIGPSGELYHQVSALFGFHVDGDALLAAVEHHEVGALAIPVGTKGAAFVAATRHLDLDHLGTQVGQHRRAKRPRHHPREVQHTDAIQDLAGRGFNVFGHRTIRHSFETCSASFPTLRRLSRSSRARGRSSSV